MEIVQDLDFSPNLVTYQLFHLENLSVSFIFLKEK